MESRIKDAIRTVYSRLEKSGIQWCLAGSANMNIQGINVEPRDLDIVMQHKDLERARELFSDYSTSSVREIEKTLSEKPAWEVEAYVGNVKVQFFGGDENDIYSSKMMSGMTTRVIIEGMNVPCLNLEAEAKAYMETSREHKAKIIKDFISERSKE